MQVGPGNTLTIDADGIVDYGGGSGDVNGLPGFQEGGEIAGEGAATGPYAAQDGIVPAYGLVLLFLPVGVTPSIAPDPLGANNDTIPYTTHIDAPGTHKVYGKGVVQAIAGVMDADVVVWAIANDVRYYDNNGTYNITAARGGAPE